MRRELNEIEYFDWCVEQPHNMVVVVRIRGALRPDRLRDALSKAQERHPMLRVNTEVGPGGIPWFSSEGVGAIPLTVVEGVELHADEQLADTELASTFTMNQAGPSRLPLMRAALLLPRDPAQPAALVLTTQHVIADGLSMVFLVRDLLRFMEDPEASMTALDAPASAQDLLPFPVRRRIPTSPRRFWLVFWLTRAYVRLRFGRRPASAPERQTFHRSWELTVEQTDHLLACCKREAVSVHAALCAAFLPGFPAIHTPVNVRPFLARPVGESVGLFVGTALVKMRYREAQGFWGNARRFHRALRRKLRDPFRIYRLFSRAVPAEAVRRLGPLLVTMTAHERPFGITNLGTLDGKGVQLRGRDLEIESFFGAVSGIVDASVLTVCTLGGRMRFHLLAVERVATPTVVRDEVDRAAKRLQAALEGEARGSGELVAVAV